MKIKYNYITFFIYGIWCLILLAIHEPWRDEVQSWLLVRDLGFFELLAQLKYEGHPIVWYLIIWPFAKLGLPFITQRIISMTVALAIAYIICFRLENKLLKILLLFSTAMMYQIPAISRNYGISALLLIIMALCHKERYRSKKVPYLICLFLLINSNLYGAVTAIALFCGDFLLIILSKFRKSTRSNFISWAPHLLVFIISFSVFYIVLFSDVFSSFQTFEVAEGSHYLSLINNPPEKIVEAVGMLGSSTVFLLDLSDIREAINLYCSNFTDVSQDLIFYLAIAFMTITILALVILAALRASNSYDCLWILTVGISAFLGTVASIMLTSLFSVRHGVAFSFLIVYLWVINDKPSKYSLMSLKPIKALNYTFFIIIFIIGLYGNIQDSKRDILNTYSYGEKAAKFLIDNNYDNDNVLILASDHPSVTTVLCMLQNTETFRFVDGDLSYVPWQIYISDDDNNYDLISEFVLEQISANSDKEILYIGINKDFELYEDYPIIYENSDDSMVLNEEYVILKIK